MGEGGTKEMVPAIRFEGFDGDWDAEALGLNASFGKGQGYSKGDLVDAGDPIVLYGRLYTQYQNEISDVDTFVIAQEKSLLSKGGEVVVPASGETAEDIARASVVVNSGVILGSDLNIIYPDETLVSIFLALTISNGKPQKDLAKRAQGKSVVHVRNGDLHDVDISFPTPKEQTKIGEYFQQLDALIAGHRGKREKLLQLKKSLLEKMFPKQGQDKPEIRFAGFEGDWKTTKLGDIATKIIEKNGSFEYRETLTNSAEFGIISQSAYFDKEISNPDKIDGYYLVGENDFVYNPRISSFAPCGPINRNNLGRTGVMSPLYTVLRVHNLELTFLEYFFKGQLWHDFMYLEGDTGARSDRFAIKSDTFFAMPIPATKRAEQTKIGQLFKHIDTLINQHHSQIDKLLNIKQACLAQMFV